MKSKRSLKKKLCIIMAVILLAANVNLITINAQEVVEEDLTVTSTQTQQEQAQESEEASNLPQVEVISPSNMKTEGFTQLLPEESLNGTTAIDGVEKYYTSGEKSINVQPYNWVADFSNLAQSNFADVSEIALMMYLETQEQIQNLPLFIRVYSNNGITDIYDFIEFGTEQAPLNQWVDVIIPIEKLAQSGADVANIKRIFICQWGTNASNIGDSYKLHIGAISSLVIREGMNLTQLPGTVAKAMHDDGTIIEEEREEFRASNAIDGNLDNEAVPGAGTIHGWDLEIELPQPVKGVNTIKVISSKIVPQLAPNYTIAVSKDGVKWINVKKQTRSFEDSYQNYNRYAYDIVATFGELEVKHVRIYDNQTCNFSRIGEVEIYADKTTTPVRNYAIEATASFIMPNSGEQHINTGDYSHITADLTIDNDTYTKAVAIGGTWQWGVQLDFERIVENINVVDLYLSYNNVTEFLPEEILLQYSTDGTDWEYLEYNVVSDFKYNGIYQIKMGFPEIDCRYIRVIDGTAWGTEQSMCVKEIKVLVDPQVYYPRELARGKTVTLFSRETPDVVHENAFAYAIYGGHQITDGNIETRAEAVAAGWQWGFKIDLGQVVSGINTIKINFAYVDDEHHHLPQNTNYEVSTDGVNWKTVAKLGIPEFSTYTEYILTFNKIDARYIRITDTTRKEIDRVMSVAEVEVYANDRLEDKSENLCLNAQASFFTDDNPNHMHNYPGPYEYWSAQYAIDNALWSGANSIGYSYQWGLKIDLKEVKEDVNFIDLYFTSNADNTDAPQSFDVRVSADGVTWSTVCSKVLEGTLHERERHHQIQFEPQDVRYVIVTDTNSQANEIQQAMAIAEVLVYANS